MAGGRLDRSAVGRAWKPQPPRPVRTAHSVLLVLQPPLGQLPDELDVMLPPASNCGRPVPPGALSKVIAGAGARTSGTCGRWRARRDQVLAGARRKAAVGPHLQPHVSGAAGAGAQPCARFHARRTSAGRQPLHARHTVKLRVVTARSVLLTVGGRWQRRCSYQRRWRRERSGVAAGAGWAADKLMSRRAWCRGIEQPAALPLAGCNATACRGHLARARCFSGASRATYPSPSGSVPACSLRSRWC